MDGQKWLSGSQYKKIRTEKEIEAKKLKFSLDKFLKPLHHQASTTLSDEDCNTAEPSAATAAPATLHTGPPATQGHDTCALATSSASLSNTDMQSVKDEMQKRTAIETYLDPSSFYGTSTPISKPGFPKVPRTIIDRNYQSRVRKFRDSSLKSKCGGGRSRSLNSLNNKRRKIEIHTGVSHSIKPRKSVVGNKKKSLTQESPSSDVSSSKTPSNKQLESANKTDTTLFHNSLLHRTRKTPRSRRKSTPWAMKFTIDRCDEWMSEGSSQGEGKRKFFKSGRSPKISLAVGPYKALLPERRKRISKPLDQSDNENYENIDDILDISERTANLSISDSTLLKDPERRDESQSRDSQRQSQARPRLRLIKPSNYLV
ncbi:hypothetical protein LSTR_LSTR006637 [Laodelphax striatellus]|uniref:Uncharacterized protein n=1 Tax=Laodelphax striatellus TaxID=195883 RepID=A0A482X8B6_LAOST|nr:hypothetical protein LSTR_LSTR006637 [Laodelphax striatellus]